MEGRPSSGSAAATPVTDNTIDEVVVTARRMDERLQDVPISITVFNQQQLQNRNIVNSADLATYTPSLSANTNFGSQNTTFAIRGFVQDIGTPPSVGVYFADVVAPRAAALNVPIGDGAGPGSYFDLQNVQVLKGPQGTLFGRNTTGGAILLVPQKPTSDYEGYIEGSVGNYDMKRIQAVLNLPLKEAVRFRVGVDHQSRGGYLTNDSGIGPKRFADVDYTTARASLVLDLTPDLENYTIASYTRSNTVGDIQKVISASPQALGIFAQGQLAAEAAKGAGFYTVQNTMVDPFAKQTQWQIINTTTWHASDHLTIKNIASYAQLHERLATALFGTNFDLNTVAPSIFPPGSRVDFIQVRPLPGGDTAAQSTYTNEVQVQGDALDSKLNYQSGVYIEESQPLEVSGTFSSDLLNCTDVYTFQCANPLGAGSVAVLYAKTFFHDVGVYGQATYSLTDKLKLTGGVRYTWDREEAKSQQQSMLAPTPGVSVTSCTQVELVAPACSSVVRQRSSAPTGLINLEYKPTTDILLYAKYSRGYRAGGITAAAPANFQVFQPEHVNSYEAGLKSSFSEPLRGSFNITGFYNDFSNQQIQVNLNPKPGITLPFSTTILNAGKSRIYGVEIYASISPIPPLTFDIDYTYLNTRIKRIAATQTSADSPYILDAPAQAGDALALSPRNKFSFTSSYRLPAPEHLGRMSVSALFTHIDEQVSNYSYRNASGQLTGLSILSPINLLNLNLNWDSIGGRPVDFQVFATNVTGSRYYTFIPGNGSATGFEMGVLGQPRMYGVRLRYRFGAGSS